jgi:hypothetical protein
MNGIRETMTVLFSNEIFTLLNCGIDMQRDVHVLNRKRLDEGRAPMAIGGQHRMQIGLKQNTRPSLNEGRLAHEASDQTRARGPARYYLSIC